jgi:hypothetical protein
MILWGPHFPVAPTTVLMDPLLDLQVRMGARIEPVGML